PSCRERRQSRRSTSRGSSWLIPAQRRYGERGGVVEQVLRLTALQVGRPGVAQRLEAAGEEAGRGRWIAGERGAAAQHFSSEIVGLLGLERAALRRQRPRRRPPHERVPGIGGAPQAAQQLGTGIGP